MSGDAHVRFCERLGVGFPRATHLVVLCRHGAAEVLEQTRRWFARMGLTLNEQKTRVCDGRREGFVFLGYTFGPMRSRKDGYRYVGAAPAPKAVQRVKGRIRQMLAPANQAPWEEVVQALNLVLRGWRRYFAYGTRLRAYRSVDRYVVGRVRRFLRRRHKVRSRGTRRYSLDMLYGSLGVYRLEDRPQWPPAHVGV